MPTICSIRFAMSMAAASLDRFSELYKFRRLTSKMGRASRIQAILAGSEVSELRRDSKQVVVGTISGCAFDKFQHSSCHFNVCRTPWRISVDCSPDGPVSLDGPDAGCDGLFSSGRSSILNLPSRSWVRYPLWTKFEESCMSSSAKLLLHLRSHTF